MPASPSPAVPAAPLIAIVEDDVAIRTELAHVLACNGFATHSCERFERVVEDVIAVDPSLVLLDLTLPGTDGQLICRELRERSRVPIIVLTSRVTELDEVMCMTLGADDFIPKPYSSRVLIAHIQALLRRSGDAPVGAGVLRHKGLELDPARSVACAQDGAGAASATGSAVPAEVELTKNELRILSLLMRRAGTIVSREELMRDLWDSDAFVDDNTLTVNINRLRATLEKIGVTGYLITHRGRGYSV